MKADKPSFKYPSLWFSTVLSDVIWTCQIIYKAWWVPEHLSFSFDPKESQASSQLKRAIQPGSLPAQILLDVQAWMLISH